MSTAIFVYAATSPVNGYFGGSLYARMGGTCFLLYFKLTWFFITLILSYGVCFNLEQSIDNFRDIRQKNV